MAEAAAFTQVSADPALSAAVHRSEEEMKSATNLTNRKQSVRDGLRIELPAAASCRGTTPLSPGNGTYAGTPQTVLFAGSSAPFNCDAGECTPHSVEEGYARQSALALLHVDVAPRPTVGNPGGGSRRGLPTISTPITSRSQEIEMRSKRSPRYRPGILDRCRSSVSLADGSYQLERSIAQESGCSSGGEGAGMRPFLPAPTINLQGGRHIEVSSPTGPTAGAEMSAACEDTPLGEEAHPFIPTAPSSPMTLVGPDDCSSSADRGNEMNHVLQEASKIRGLRLTWLLYALIVIAIVLFVLVLVQIVFETNRMLSRSATEAVQVQAASLLNSVSTQRYAVEELIGVMHDLQTISLDSDEITLTTLQRIICFSIGKAPIAFALYNASGDQQWKAVCQTDLDTTMPMTLPSRTMHGVRSVRIVDYGTAAIAYRTFYDDGRVREILALLIDKNKWGRNVMDDGLARYSSATLQHLTSAIFTRNWWTNSLSMMFHSLTKDAPNYLDTINSSETGELTSVFRDVCYEGSPYLWHTVMAPMNVSRNLFWQSDTASSIPAPRIEHHRAWGQPSRATLCGVQCSSDAGTVCAFDNPTNTWFLVDYALSHLGATQGMVTIIGALSIVAVILFTFIMLLVYISITVPVNYLRYQLLRAGGSIEAATPWERHIIRWTHHLWLGDLTAIVRSIHILSLCFRLNKKYVPDHVLRNHAKQLYEGQRDCNFLDEVQLMEDAVREEDTDSENDGGVSTPERIVGMDGTCLPHDSHFLWPFHDLHELGGAPDFGAAETAAQAAPPLVAALHAAECSPLCAAPQQPPGTAVVPCDGAVCGVRSARDRGEGCTMREAQLTHGSYGELDEVGGAQEGCAAGNLKMGLSYDDVMAIRRDSESTILCVRIPSVELAFLINYSGAVHQHRRIMRMLLHRIRRHKGALFHCSGDCLGAIWNAFEVCPNHAESAAVCAQEIANAFAPYWSEGLHLGLVLHQGTLVCGTVEYSKTAFVTAFGDGPRESLAVAELAATVRAFHILVTEPVKQALAGLYDCNIVDVVALPHSSHPLLLFELGCSRQVLSSPSGRSLPDQLRTRFSIEYARIFAQFRNHEFTEALQGIQQLHVSIGRRYDHLLRRLERLCRFYAAQPSGLPCPYYRSLPTWTNYEAIAQAGLNRDPIFAAMQDEGLMGQSQNPEVVYQGVPVLRNSAEYIQDFKQELHANMRRIGSPQATTVTDGFPEACKLSSFTRQSPQSSPSQPPTAAFTSGSTGHAPIPSENVLAVRSPTVTVKVFHVDPCCRSSSCDPPLPMASAASPSQLNLDPPTAAALTVAAAAVRSDAFTSGARASPLCSQSSSPLLSLCPSSRFSLARGLDNFPLMAMADSQSRLDGSPCHLSCAASRTLALLGSMVADGASRSGMLSTAASPPDTTGGDVGSCSASHVMLPKEIKARNGTTYIRSTRVLGRGSFGSVYLGMDAHSGRLVAIKFLPLPHDESGMSVIEAEVDILQRVNDTHVVQLLTYAFDGDNIVIIMECMLAGSLQNMITAFRTIPSTTARVFMRDILRGLNKLHSMGVIHRDMKPQNVLLSLAGNCKISDFGASAWLQELARKESNGEVCGTPVYLAPEAARGSPEKRSDIWSCGIMYLQMITGRLPYSAEQLAAGPAALVYQIGSGIVQPTIPDNLDALDEEFVHICLERDPRTCTSVASLLQLPLFTV